MKIDKYLHKIKINNFQAIKKMLDQSDKPIANKQPQTENKKTPKNNFQSKTASRLITLLQELKPELQKKLLNTFLRMNLPLKESNLKKIINFINTNSVNIKNQSLIKALALNQKSGLPIDGRLVEGIGSNFDSQTPQLDKITQIINNKNQFTQLLENILLDPSQSPEKITEKLKKYPGQLQQIMDGLVENTQKRTGTENKLLNQLLGQQLINQQNNLLLALELPLQWPEQDKKIPFYLKIWEDNIEKNNGNKAQDDTSEYKIAFSINLEKKGLINSLLKIRDNKLEAVFKAEKRETVKLINTEITKLKTKLAQFDYSISLKVLQEEKEKLKVEQSLPLQFSQENDDLATEKNYQHVDFTV